MALQHADNFSIYGTNTAFMTNGVYAQVDPSVSLPVDPDGVSGGRVLLTPLNGEGIRRILSSNQNTCGQAVRLWMPNLPDNSSGSGETPTIEFRDGSNVTIASLGCDTTGRLSVYSGPARIFGSVLTPLQTTSAPVVSAKGWYHIEMWITMSGGSLTNMQYEVRVEGVTVLSGNAVATAHAGPVSQVYIGANNFANLPWYWKDYVVADGSGSQNNTFLGSVLVTALTTTSDVLLNWTPSTGSTGFPILADIPPDDTKYISGDIAHINLQYKGGLSDLPTTVTSVKGLITFVRAAKADGGDGSLQNGIISGASTGLGANRPITTAQTYWQDVFELNPATSAAWTVAAVNAANIQINRTV